MKFHGNNEVFIENIRLAGMSNDNSSPVFKNSGSRSNYFHWQLVQRQIAKLSRGVWAQAIEYSRIRAVNQSLHYCSCGILTFSEEVLKFMDWLEFLICWCDRLQHRNEERIGIVILKIENHSEYSNTQLWKAKHVLLLQWLGAVPSSALKLAALQFFSFAKVLIQRSGP